MTRSGASQALPTVWRLTEDLIAEKGQMLLLVPGLQPQVVSPREAEVILAVLQAQGAPEAPAVRGSPSRGFAYRFRETRGRTPRAREVLLTLGKTSPITAEKLAEVLEWDLQATQRAVDGCIRMGEIKRIPGNPLQFELTQAGLKAYHWLARRYQS